LKELEEKAKIFTKGIKGTLTKYQKAVNEASIKLCEENPSLVFQRNKLFEEARKKVRESGYDFAKGSSRAQGLTDEAVPPKRVKTTTDDRAEYIQKLQSDISSKEDQIRYKQNRIDKARNVKN
jgi:hypothetical protein